MEWHPWPHFHFPFPFRSLDLPGVMLDDVTCCLNVGGYDVIGALHAVFKGVLECVEALHNINDEHVIFDRIVGVHSRHRRIVNRVDGDDACAYVTLW